MPFPLNCYCCNPSDFPSVIFHLPFIIAARLVETQSLQLKSNLRRTMTNDKFQMTNGKSSMIYWKRLRYSPETRNALTISACSKLPLNWFSLPSQNWNPSASGSRRR